MPYIMNSERIDKERDGKIEIDQLHRSLSRARSPGSMFCSMHETPKEIKKTVKFKQENVKRKP